VVTLAEVMADRIEAGGVARERIAVIPNGVDVEAFPVLSRNLRLAAELGIDEGTTVIGYISSLVEYEGIDTLISAYAAVKASSPVPVALLIVGDGAVRERLMRQAAALGLEDAIFTGRVAHDVVLDYYSLIDIFVVPRKPVEVCHLVMPLKPFEAFSTGRTVVLSNVRALARLAEQSRAAELFEAGDEQSLAAVLIGLLKDPQRRTELAATGAAWVRTERTWAANADAYVHIYEQIGAIPLGDDARSLLKRGRVLEAYALLADAGSLPDLDAPGLRRLRDELRRRGYLGKAREVARVCVDGGGQTQDTRELAQIEGEIAVFSGEFVPSVRPEDPGYASRPGRVLHVVGNSLPHKQSGYTLRTHYSAVAQREAGLDPHVVTQMGFGHDGDDYASEEVDGITYHRIPGPVRGSEPLDTWMRTHVQRVANLARVVRPAVLHAASDFINAQTAEIVGREFGIPVVYESRGFWEETWLSRQAQAFGWDDLGRLEATHGLPDVYLWRREIEDRSRCGADRVVTLAEVMADRIEVGGVARERIAVIPNGVDVEAFPVLSRNLQLAAELGIDEGTTVIGYISSLVEYEGIDTLVAAYAAVKASSPTPVALLIVGDGAVRERLMAQAAALGLEDAIFTGRVAHDVVLDYYSLIDIFVVPRKPVEVCHLVTPLKPFEAFSTGRTVVLSNVRALARLAEQSGAAELFEAGDEQSLAAVLIGLLKDPQRRRELAEAGTVWVRAERTWAANADTYIRLYEGLGVVAMGETRIPRLTAERVNIERFRRALADRGPIPFEILSSDDASVGADDIMENGWVHGTHPAVLLDEAIDWTTVCMSNRSWNFRLHSWDFMGPVLRAFVRKGERRYLDWCIDRAVSWARVFNEADARGTMAWYDMALGLRGHRMAYVVEQAVLGDTSPDNVSVLLACVVRHQQEYFADSAFNARNNHGVYVALGEIALARRLRELPGMDVMAAQGRDRMDIMTRTQFAKDGGHLEHSPEYHRMVLASLGGATAAGLLDDEEVRRRVSLAEEALGWFIQPNGELVQVGDSIARQMRSRRPRTSSDTTEFLVSAGARGRPNDNTLRLLPDSGYAIVRSPQPKGSTDHLTSSHLLLAAGFHSRTHKHADDLTVTWFDQGHEILIDAGRYGYVDLLPEDSPLRQQGYYYSAPERQYVESTRAHNTIEADGRDHVRRGREPYGAAIKGADERDGYYRVEAEVDHGAWRHRREIVFLPGRWLLVTDTLTSGNDAAHDYRQWWNFPEEIEPRATDYSGLAVEMLGSTGTLWVTELCGSGLIAPVKAQRDPLLRGWRSKYDLQFTPAWSTGFEAVGVRDHEFRTLFSFSDQRPAGPFDHPFDRTSGS
jgi:glycosyltransferase involved in cell wall biosynthesis